MMAGTFVGRWKALAGDWGGLWEEQLRGAGREERSNLSSLLLPLLLLGAGGGLVAFRCCLGGGQPRGRRGCMGRRWVAVKQFHA